MAQATDYELANQSGASFRSELNTILAAIASANSGATEPTTMYPYMLWADTSSGFLKQRNAANNAWISILKLSSGEVSALLSPNLSGNLTFTGTGNRITGDFSNATLANRVMFQTSTVNSNTAIGAIANGTGTTSQFTAFSGSDPDNASTTVMQAAPAVGSNFIAGQTGSGSYLPMRFLTNNTERMSIDTSGNVGINGINTGGLGKLEVLGTGYQAMAVKSTDASGVQFAIAANAATEGRVNVVTNHPLVMYTNNTERMRIDTSGNVLVTNAAGLGYGTGAGGTVTQATSRTTGVTLNKPTGAITMFTAAGSTTAATFTVTNSLVAATDTIILSVKSSTNLYDMFVSAVAAGSFNITFRTTGGTSSDAPVINFAIIKGATS